MARKYTKGKFHPKNPKKYKGDLSNIVYRSSYELKMFIRLDMSRGVLAWNSEEVVIPYFYELDQKWHRYFMDVWYKARKHDGSIIERLVEIKPKVQTQPPKPQKRQTKRYINEVLTWQKNKAKWNAAHKYAKERGMTFHLFTEKELGIHK